MAEPTTVEEIVVTGKRKKPDFAVRTAAKKPAALKAYKPSLRERAQIGMEGLYTRATGREPGYAPRRLMGKASELLDFIPGVGDVIGIDETKRALDRRQYLEAGLTGAGTMLGVVPIVGDVAGKALKGAAKPAQQAVEKLAAKYGVAAPAVVSRVSGYEKRLPSLPGIDREKLAADYPDRLPGELMTDPKTGKEYLGKVLSPEALAVEKHRKLIQADIKAGDYTPFFNVEDRYQVDPSNYPIVGNTQIDAMPKRPDTLAKYKIMLDTDDARARLMTAYEGSAGNPMAENWYAMGQMEKAYVDELGPEAGREAFRNKFANAMAATTGGADPVSNYLMAKYGNFAQERGLALPTAAYDMPYPIGGRFAAGNMAQYEKMINQGAGITASANPKRFNFAANFMGYQDPATMDEVMSGLILPGLKEPPGPSYGVAEKVVLDEAKKLKRPGSRLQDRAWIGDKMLRTPGYKPGPMIQVPNEAIARTARLLGMDPDEVFARMVRDSIPTYAGGGLVKKYGL